jgi:translation initiation factor 2 subunit 1
MVKRKGFPAVGEVVLVTVKNITPYSALCTLNEYPGKEGMIHVSEVSGKWVRDIRNFVKNGKQYPAKVTKTDPRKGHINLSLKRVSKKAKEKKIQDFKKEEHAEKMLGLMAKKLDISLEQAYEKIGYELQEKFGDMFVAFENALENPELLERRSINKKYIQLMTEIAKENIQKKEVNIKAILDLKFYTGDGINRVKEFLNSLTNKYKWDIKYISAPRYSIEIKTNNPKEAERQLRENLEKEISKLEEGVANFSIGGD